jgi:hypothetical protein
MTSCREVKGREIIRERDPERKISSMQIGGDIPIGGVTLLPIMSLERKEQRHEYREKEQRHGDREKDQKHEDRGSSPKARYPFPLMSKGER